MSAVVQRGAVSAGSTVPGVGSGLGGRPDPCPKGAPSPTRRPHASAGALQEGEHLVSLEHLGKTHRSWEERPGRKVGKEISGRENM